ncbi:MAG TPA: aldehyde dehydrogenase family protein [Kineosporiaceae bacterium]|nr:aldehyde dehydrogenase family protein [Kineosporiaceae bacterium]
MSAPSSRAPTGTGRPLVGTDPRDGRPVGDGVPEAGPAQAAAAAEAAAEALRNRPPAGAPGGFDDAALLDAVAAGLEDAAPDLAELAERETGLGADRLRGEVVRTVHQLRAFAGAHRDGLLADAIIDTGGPAEGGDPARPDQRRVARPLGPVAVFSASNFPFAFSTAGGDTASALAAGCPVILKAHPDHPATSRATGEVVDAAVAGTGAPADWFQVLHGGATELGQALVTAPDVAAVAFTGSLRGGRALFDATTRREVPIPVFAEMSSVNPVVVTPAALAGRGGAIGELLAGTVVGSAGQLCTKPNLVLTVRGPGLQDLVDAMVEILRRAPELVMLTGRLRDAFDTSWHRLVRTPGVEEVVAAETLPRDGAWESPGLARVSAAVLLARPDLLEERFGPGTVVAVADDLPELTRLAGQVPGSLTATVHAEPGEAVPEQLLAVLASRAGRLVWNGVPTGVTVGYATVHGGPYPATTAPSTTSVGMTAARRFQRPVGYQSWPDPLLPAELRDANPLGIVRLVDGVPTRAAVRR